MPVLEAPGALWLGLAVPAILLLWMLRPRRPRIRVPSVLLWGGSPAERQSARPWQRLRQHPLLWLQLAVALLLALAAARPFQPAQGASQHLIVLLDASGSMRAQDAAPDRFAAARSAVLDLARAMGPGQDMTVIRLDEEPRVLVASSADTGQIGQALADQVASYGSADVATGLALAAGLTQGPAEWIVVSDGGLTIPDDARRPVGTTFRAVQIGGSAGNVAVTGLVARAGPDGLTVQAGVRNTGSAPASGRLQLLADGQLVGAREWRLGAGETTYVSWSDLPQDVSCPVGATSSCAGALASAIEARLAGVDGASNALESDDRAWAAVGSTQQARVLLVSQGNAFLERMLTISPELRAFRTAPADWSSVATQAGPFPLTVLDRLWPDAPPAGNAFLVGPPNGTPFRPQEVRLRDGHPLLRYVDWSDVHVAAARRIPLDASWEPLVESDGGPLVAVREVGGRREAVLTFDLAQSDLALRPAFPVLMANLLGWLLPRAVDAPRTVAVGDPAAIEPAPLAQQVWAEGPDGARIALAPPWPPRPFRPPAPGLYRIVQSGEGGEQVGTLIADGYQSEEADLAPRPLALPAERDAPPPAAQSAIAWWPWLAAAVLLFALGEWWVDARGR